jgi:nucleotide-binding universal stress UspA family protein
MVYRRIAVGLDGSARARHALAWAVRESRRRGARLLVVTAWPEESRRRARMAGRLHVERLRLQRMQVECIASATRGMRQQPLIGRELILADPVTALCHAAAWSDLVVVGGGRVGDDPDGSIAGRVAARLASRRRLDATEPAGAVLAVPTSTMVATSHALRGRHTSGGAAVDELCRSCA